MKRIILFCIILILTSEFAIGQTDSILNKQVEATRNVGNQIRRLRKEVEKINPFFQNKVQSTVDSIYNLQKEIDDLERSVSQIETEFTDTNIKEETKEENIWERSTPQIVGAFIGAGSALFVFYLGMRRERKRERKKQKKEHKEKIHYLSSLLKSTIELSIKQLNGLKEFCEKIDKNPINIPLIPIHPIQDIKRLSQVFDNEQYYHAFLDEFGNENENVGLYRGLANNVDFLQKQFEQMFEMQDKKQVFDVNRKREYGSLLEVVKDEVLRLGQYCQGGNKPFSDFILNTFRNHHDSLTDEKRTQLKYYEESLVSPLKNGFIEQYSNLPEVSFFVQKLKRLTTIYGSVLKVVGF